MAKDKTAELHLALTREQLSRASDRKVIRASQCWMVDRVMGTGQVHIFAGPSGSGKTSFILPFIKKWSEGQDVFGYKSYPAPFAYISCDRSMNELDQTLTRLGLQDWDIPCLSIEELESKFGKAIKTQTDTGIQTNRLDHTAVTIRDLPRLLPWVKVFFIEAIGWFSPTTSKSNQYTETLKYWSSIRVDFEQKGLTIVGTTHAPKSKPESKYANARDRIIGSVAQAGIASCIVVFDLEKESDVRDKGRIVTLLPRNEPNQIFRYTLDDKGRFENEQKIDKQELEVAEYSLIKELEGLQVDTTLTTESIAGIVERANVSPATMYRVLGNLVKDGFLSVAPLRGPGGKKFYRLVKPITSLSLQ